MPTCRFSVFREGFESDRLTALVDSGAACNVISQSSANELLNLSAEEAVAEDRPKTQLKGMGSQGIGYGWQVTLTLFGSDEWPHPMELPNVWVWVVKCDLPFAMLLGQYHGLQQKVMRHHNHSANRFWEIRPYVG